MHTFMVPSQFALYHLPLIAVKERHGANYEIVSVLCIIVTIMVVYIQCLILQHLGYAPQDKIALIGWKEALHANVAALILFSSILGVNNKWAFP